MPILIAALCLLSVLIYLSCSADIKQPINTGYIHHYIEKEYPNGHISAIFAKDIDGDGWLDIVIRSGKSGSAEIAWYHNLMKIKKGKNDKKWEKFVISNDSYPKGSLSSGSGLIVFDIDKDGKPDIITGAKDKKYGNALFWWKCPNDPFGGQWKRYLIAPPDPVTSEEYAPHDILVADIDDDGVDDLIIGGSSNQGAYWMKIPRNLNEEPLWELNKIGAARGYSYAGLAVGDIDKDGRKDIVFGDLWFRATGTLGKPIWEPYAYGLVNTPPSNIEVNDVDKNGYLDIVVASGHNPTRGEIVWYTAKNDVKRIWNFCRISRKLAAPESLLVKDNRRGDVEIITAELDYNNKIKNPKVMKFIQGSDPEKEWKELIIYQGKNFRKMQQADLDNDGDMDLYACSFTEKNGYAHIDWFENVNSKKVAD